MTAATWLVGASEMSDSQTIVKLLAVLKPDEVVSSSSLIQRLLASGIPNATARQILGRASKHKEIWRTELLKLQRNERLFARSSFVGNAEFFGLVRKVLIQNGRRGLVRCLDVLKDRKLLNWVDAVRLLAVSTSNDETDSSRRPDFGEEIQALKELGIELFNEHIPNWKSLVLRWTKDDNAIHQEAVANARRLQIDALLCRVLCRTLSQQNMFGWNQIELPTEEQPFTEFNTQIFSGSAFSYLAPLSTQKTQTQKAVSCPVVIDCFSEVVSVDHVESFYDRLVRASHRGKKPQRMLGVFAATGFTKDAWILAKSKGFLTINLSQLYGNAALDAMASVERLIQNFNDGSSELEETQIDDLSAMLEKLKDNPIVTALRSIGFEVMTGLVLKSMGYEQTYVGKTVTWKETKRDIDVFGLRSDELLVVECKANQKGNSPSETDVRKFFCETVPALKDWLQTTQRPFRICKAELWTTGVVSNEARNALSEISHGKQDQWSIKTIDELRSHIPECIRKRLIDFTDAISMGDTTRDTDDSN